MKGFRVLNRRGLYQKNGYDNVSSDDSSNITQQNAGIMIHIKRRRVFLVALEIYFRVQL